MRTKQNSSRKQTAVEEVVETWDVVPNIVVSFPASEKREPWSDFQLDRFFLLQQVRCGNVTDFVPN